MTDLNDTTLCHPRVSRDDPMRQQCAVWGPFEATNNRTAWRLCDLVCAVGLVAFLAVMVFA